jgi:hypothetical protein
MGVRDGDKGVLLLSVPHLVRRLRSLRGYTAMSQRGTRPAPDQVSYALYCEIIGHDVV